MSGPMPQERAQRAKERYERAVKVERLYRDAVTAIERLSKVTMRIDGGVPVTVNSPKLEESLIGLKAGLREAVAEATDAYQAYSPVIEYLKSLKVSK